VYGGGAVNSLFGMTVF